MAPTPVPRSRPLPRKSPRILSHAYAAAAVPLTALHRPSRPKALFVVISKYPDTEKYQTLDTVLRDLETLRTYLIIEKCFLPSDIRILHCGDPTMRPTKHNIFHEIDLLVKNTGPGDFRLFYHAGHVEQRRTKSKTERDSMDEAIVTVDEADSSHPGRNLILDNELRVRLVNGMGAESTLLAILEGCHSETLLDLDTTRVYSRPSRALSSDVVIESGSSGSTRFHTFHGGVQRGRKTSRRSSGPAALECTKTQNFGLMQRTASPMAYRGTDEFAKVISISACLDHQESKTNDKTMVHFLVELLRTHATSPLTPRMLQEQLTVKLLEEKLRVVRARFAGDNGTLNEAHEKQVREMQNPKVSALRGTTYLLDWPLVIPKCNIIAYKSFDPATPGAGLPPS